MPQPDPSPDPVPTPDPNPAPRDTGKNQLDLTASTNLQKLLPDTVTTNSTFKQQFNSQLNTKLSQPANLSTLKGNQQLPQTGENTHEGWLISLVGIMLVATASNWLPRKR